MRLLFEILIIGALIYLMWDVPLKQRVDKLRAAVTSKQTTAPPMPIPTPHGAWLWDPNHHGTLDRPSPSPTGRP